MANKPEDGLLNYFRNEKKRHLDAAQALTDKARAAARDLTEDEDEQSRRHLTEAAAMQTKMKAILDGQVRDDAIAQLGQELGTPPERMDPSKARTWGDALVASDVYQAAKDRGFSGEWSSPNVEFRATVGDPLLPQTGSNADAIPETFIRQLETPGLRQEQLTLASLFTTVPVESGPTIRYPILTARTAASGAVVDPGADKPYAEYTFDDATVTLAKRAAFIAIAEEMMEDAPYIAAFINSDLPFMVSQNEETAFATALYTAVTETAAASTIGGDNAWDAIMAGVTEVRMNFFAEPDALFIHPLDWASTVISKAVAGTGGYFGTGPNGAPSTNLWGTPARVVVSQKAVQGFPIVGAFRLGGKVYRKGDVRLRMSTSHEDFFQKNLVAILAEVRSALGVTYPEAFAEIDIAS